MIVTDTLHKHYRNLTQTPVLIPFQQKLIIPLKSLADAFNLLEKMKGSAMDGSCNEDEKIGVDAKLEWHN